MAAEEPHQLDVVTHAQLRPRGLDQPMYPGRGEPHLMRLRGASNQDIARTRGVSVRTVANQLAAVYRKLGVRSRAEL